MHKKLLIILSIFTLLLTNVKSDEIVIIGDNLEYSTDSRKIGPVGIDCIIGKVI